MNIEFERRQIIEELSHLEDEWIFNEIKRVLGLDVDDEVPEEHKQILDERIREFESGQMETVDWEDIKIRLSIV